MVAFSQTNNLGIGLSILEIKRLIIDGIGINEVQYRNFNFIGDTEQVLIRTGLGYNLTENNNNILLGAAFIYSEPYLANSDTKTSF